MLGPTSRQPTLRNRSNGIPFDRQSGSPTSPRSPAAAVIAGGGGPLGAPGGKSATRHFQDADAPSSGGGRRGMMGTNDTEEDYAGDGGQFETSGLESFETGRLSRTIEVPFFEFRRYQPGGTPLGSSTPSFFQALFRPSPTLRVLDIGACVGGDESGAKDSMSPL